MKLKLVFPLCLTLIILTCLFACPRASAPMCEITLAEKFYFEVRGAKWEKLDAMDGFEKWPAYYGHTQQEIWDIIEKESQFDVHATSRAGAMGLMQPTRSAIKSLPDGSRYYRYYMADGRKVWIMHARNGTQYHALHTNFIYRPFYNIKIGCQFLRICKNMAREKGPQVLGRFVISTNELKDIYYVAGVGNYERCIKVALLYMQNTNQQLEGGEL